jgi:hypothetical protein
MGTPGDKRGGTSFQTFIDKLQAAGELKDLIRARIAAVAKSSQHKPVRPVMFRNPASMSRRAPAPRCANLSELRALGQVDTRAVVEMMQELEERVAEHPLWANAGREELAAAGARALPQPAGGPCSAALTARAGGCPRAGEGIEKLVAVKLFDRIFHASDEARAQDQRLAERLACLQFLLPAHLDIPPAAVARARPSIEVPPRPCLTMSQRPGPAPRLLPPYLFPFRSPYCMPYCCSEHAEQVIAWILSTHSALPATSLLCAGGGAALG